MRITCNGSTIDCDVDGSGEISSTDTVLTVQVNTGFRDFGGASAQRWDDYDIADLAAAATSLVIPRKPLRAMIGR